MNIIKIKTQIKGLIYVRDALSFYMTSVRVSNNQFQIVIIVCSLFTALFDTCSSELNLSESENNIIMKSSVLFPIFCNTFIAFISSMMKFMRLAEKLEEVSKTIERCHYAINKHREYLAACDVSKESEIKPTIDEVNLCFREALLSAEVIWLSRMDPITKSRFLQKSESIHQLFEKCDEEVDYDTIKILYESFGTNYLEDSGFFSKLLSKFYKKNNSKYLRKSFSSFQAPECSSSDNQNENENENNSKV